MDEVMVSVCMLAYNHERFIRHALESVVTQKTNFKYEIIIHDDASPDGTADIIREYEKKYPDIIKPIYQTENQFSKGVKIGANYIHPRIKGKYIAVCECDDYWIDEYKLQKQVDFLEAHPDIICVAHQNQIVDVNENIKGYSHKNMPLDKFYTKEDAVKYGARMFHPNSVLYRNIVHKPDYIEGRNYCCTSGGHTFLIYYLMSKSDIYIMKDCMSAWRSVVEEGGTSYQSRSANDPIKYKMLLIDMYTRFRRYFGDIYNFDERIRSMTAEQINSVLKSKMSLKDKYKNIKQLLSLLEAGDIVAMPKHETMQIIRKIKSVQE